MQLQKKYDKLKEIVLKSGSGVVAYSGGVDSTLLVKVAHDVLGDNVMAVTAVSSNILKAGGKGARSN